MNLKTRIDRLEKQAAGPTLILESFSDTGPWSDFWKAFGRFSGNVTSDVLSRFASPFRQQGDRMAAEMEIRREDRAVRRLAAAAGLDMETFDRWIDEMALADVRRCGPSNLSAPPAAPEGGWSSLRETLSTRCRDAAGAWSYEDPRARWTFTYVFWTIVAEALTATRVEAT